MPKLILASQSAARQAMLSVAGYTFEAIPADIDEQAVIDSLPHTDAVALTLAQHKARFISEKYQDNHIIGSDQILVYNNKIYSKASNKNEAIDRLKEFSGQEHRLTSAVAVYKNNQKLFEYQDTAILKMKPLTDDQINNYADKAGDILTSCVGCYALEGLGLRLFEDIEGDYHTILGMPLLPLTNFLDKEGFTL